MSAEAATETKPRSLAIYVPDLSGGGLERLQLDLAPLFIAAGYEVTFVLNSARGELVDQVPPGARVRSLNAGRQLLALKPLYRYLQDFRPDIVVAHTEHTAITTLWARALARRCKTKVIICQHNTASEQSHRRGWQFRIVLLLMRCFFGWADEIVAVSGGVADDLASSCGIARERITVIYNGVVGSGFLEKSSAALDHPWFSAGQPVIVAAGRFVAQKDFGSLIRAFAIVSQRRDVRLVLLGDGPLRKELEDLAKSLGVAERIDMPGFRANPLPFFRRAAVVVLSSRYEGFAMVLAEALACGSQVVSTECPHGPAEILDHGRYGRLTPVADPDALSRAILATLDAPLPRSTLENRGRTFTISASANRYLELFDSVLATLAPSPAA
jgi:glycosyltransferase involved in cell wall biosynthesis